MEIETLIRALGGAAPRRLIVARGGVGAAAALAKAVREQRVVRARTGWYTTLPLDDPRVVAVVAGGALTGVTLLRLHGAWLWNPPRYIDICLPAGARVPAPPPRGARFTHDRKPRRLKAGVEVDEALLHAVSRLPFEEAVAVLDWACHTGRLDLFGLHELCNRLSRTRRHIAAWVDRDCESVLESIVRTRLRRAGYHVSSQVLVGDLQAIDLVVEGVVGIELDGRTFHASTFEADRRKDLSIVRGGRSALRASYSMVREDWPEVLDAIHAAVKMHRPSPRSRRRAGMQRRNARLPPP